MNIQSKKDRYSRRAVLKRLGVGAGMLPLLSTEWARGQSAASPYPKRFIAITWTNGTVPASFFPSGGAGPLAQPLPAILSPLEPYKSSLLVMRSAGGQTGPIDLTSMLDADRRYDGHFAYESLLTGANKGGAPSIDQLIGDALKAKGVAGAQLNVGARPYASSTSWRAAGQKNSADTDPYHLFSRLFSGATMTPTQVNSLLQRRQSVLDFVGGELTRFATTLGTDDRVAVQSHLEAIRGMEKKLQTTTPVGGACKAPDVSPAGVNFKDVNNYPKHVAMIMNIVAATVKCDLARAITVDLIDDGGGNSLTFPWLGVSSPDYHAIAHNGSASYGDKVKIDQWYYSNVAALVKQLAETPEGTGTALDNTVILVMQDMNEGSNHGTFSIPYLLIGSGGGFFKTGRMVTFASHVSNNKLLTSILHAMDVMVPGVGPSQYAGDLDSVLRS